MADVEKTIRGMRQWIDDNEDRFRLAEQHLKDPEFIDKLLLSLKVWLEDVMGYSPIQHSSDVAVYVVGRLQDRAGELFDDVEFILQYKEERERFEEKANELRAQAEGLEPSPHSDV